MVSATPDLRLPSQP